MSGTDRDLREPELDTLVERFKAACTLRQPIDRERIRKCMLEWASLIYRRPFHIRFIDNMEAAIRADRFTFIPAGTTWEAGSSGVDQNIWSSSAAGAVENAAIHGNPLSNWWSCSLASRNAVKARVARDRAAFHTWRPVLEAFEAGAFTYWFTQIADPVIAVAGMPSYVHLDARHRLHKDDGPAFAWLGVEYYYWHGVYVPPDRTYIILHPETITCADIDRESNAELRRIMIEHYGQDRYLLDSGGRMISEEGLYQLYRKDLPGREPLVMVRVVNATPEPDGTRRIYWLRVPPHMRDAKAAVAWTFGLTPEQYKLVVET